MNRNNATCHVATDIALALSPGQATTALSLLRDQRASRALWSALSDLGIDVTLREVVRHNKRGQNCRCWAELVASPRAAA